MGFEITGGGLYVLGPDGQYSMLEKIEDCNVECTATEEINDLDYLPLSINNLTDSFTGTVQFTKETFMAFLGLNKAIIAACPNKRVAYLATHARKKRTRIKNLNRAIKMLED
jgi:hypothetical protein